MEKELVFNAHYGKVYYYRAALGNGYYIAYPDGKEPAFSLSYAEAKEAIES